MSANLSAAAAGEDFDYSGTDCDALRNGTAAAAAVAESCQLSQAAPQPFMIVIQGGGDSTHSFLPKIVPKFCKK